MIVKHLCFHYQVSVVWTLLSDAFERGGEVEREVSSYDGGRRLDCEDVEFGESCYSRTFPAMNYISRWNGVMKTENGW